MIEAELKKEAGLYIANPLAFWLRPDRDEHDCPCWMIEGDWVPNCEYLGPRKLEGPGPVKLEGARVIHLLPGEEVIPYSEMVRVARHDGHTYLRHRGRVYKMASDGRTFVDIFGG